MSASSPARRGATPPVVLSFAAADPTCGAGAQADVLAIAARGCHPASVITALTVQDTHGVARIEPAASELVEEQALRLLADLRVGAFKLGVLGSAQNAAAVGRVLAAHPHVPVVVDPVLASGRGDPLADAALVEALRGLVLPLASIATPNVPEAERLGGVAAILRTGCRHVLLTGTHAPGDDVVNVLHDASGVLREDHWPRIEGEFHGSGCTLAAAIAAALAHGRVMAQAVREAQEYTWRTLAEGYRAGSGQLIPQRLHRPGP